MIMFFGIDGTGDANHEKYKNDMVGSCINQLANNEVVPFDKTFYHRGPSLPGTETRSYAKLVESWILEEWSTGKVKAIFLGGYSRGAAAVIEIAYWLKAKDIPVECLILFDAVDRSLPGPGGGVGGIIKNRAISSNVKQVIHPMRNQATTFSRLTFGRCGSTQENPLMPHAREYFHTTHAGAGGVPWTSIDLPIPVIDVSNPLGTIWGPGEPLPTKLNPQQDAAGAAIVRAWTFPKVMKAFFDCKKSIDKPVSPGIPGNVGTPKTPATNERIHIVRSGDWLSKLAITYYNDMNRWPEIYQRNIETIGPNPDLIKVGQRLIIP